MIVAAVDRSDRASIAIKEADALAKAFDEPVHVVHVMTRSEFVDLGRSAVEDLDDSFDMNDVREAAAEVAERAAEGLDTPSKAVGLMADPADGIVQYANDENARYIVVSPRKRSPTGKAVFGSTAQSILLNSEVPVVSSIA